MGWGKFLRNPLREIKNIIKDPINLVAPFYKYNNTKAYNLYKALKGRKQDRNPLVDAGLQDKSFSTADYGAPLTIGYGKFKTNGKVIYGLDEFRDYSRTYDDNGQTIVERVYEIDIAWVLCKGPVIGVSRIWLDDKLILDTRSDTTGAVGEDLYSYSVQPSGRIEFVRRVSGDVNLETYNIYLGTADQEPDEMMVLNLGADKVPAHRGWCYITCQNLYLNPHNRRVPNLTAEVVVSGTVEDVIAGPTVLSGFIPDPGETLELTSRYAMAYASANNNVLFMLTTNISGSGSNSEDGYQLQAFDLDSKAQRFDLSIYGGDINEGGTWVVDNANNVVWLKDLTSLSAINILNGTVQASWEFASGYVFGSNSVECFTARNEIWYTQTISSQSYINIASASTLLSGASSVTNIAQINLGFGLSTEAGLVYIPHKQWMLAISQGGREYKIYAGDQSVVSSGTLGSSGEFYYLASGVVDAVNDCVWCVMGSTAPRYLIKFSLSDYSTTSMRDMTGGIGGNSTPQFIAIDSLLGYAVCYNDQTEDIEFISGSGTIIKSIDYSAKKAAEGRPVGLLYLPDSGDLIVRSQVKRVFWYRLDLISSDTATLSSVVTDLAEQVGIASGDMDVTGIAGTTINGIAIEDRSQAKATLDILQRAAFFDLVQEDGKVKAKKRGSASVLTIDYTELAIGEDEEQKRPYEFIRLDERDVPERMEILYSDIDLEYEDGLQSSTRHVVRSLEVEQQTIPVLMTASQAKQIAEVELYSRWSQRVGIRLQGTRKHWMLRAGDVFTFTDELGVSRTLLCTSIEFISMTGCVIDARMEDASVYTSTVTGAGSSWTPPVISAATSKRFELLDIPILRDADDYQGFYVVALTGAPTASLHESLDGGVTYTNKGAIAESILGYASTVLASFAPGNVWDTVSTVTIVVYNGSLSSATDEQLLAGVNSFLIGNEIVQAATVTPAGTNTYTLTRLLRGRRGTEWAIGLHSAGERFVDLSGVGRISSSLRGSLAYYKAVPSGVNASTVAAVAFTNTQAGMKPYSPVLIAGSRDGGLNLTLTWVRRSRIGSAWGSVIDIPLDDSIEKYEIDIMSGSVVKRTITVTSATTASYTAAEQTTDFGSTQSSILVHVYQLSSIVGRGTVGVATV